MRRGIDTLASMVLAELGGDPRSEDCFVFVGRDCRRLTVLVLGQKIDTNLVDIRPGLSHAPAHAPPALGDAPARHTRDDPRDVAVHAAGHALSR